LDFLVRYLQHFLSFHFSIKIIPETAGSGLADPSLSGVTDCTSWAHYIQNSGGDFYSNCSSNPALNIKCSFTCGGN